MFKEKKKGRLIVISSPSGAGKTTITKKIISANKDTELSVSLTTRKPRKKEINGVDYLFVKNNTFKEFIKKKKFLEYAKVFDHYYGTLKENILKKIKKKKIILLDIDWQGARQVRKSLPNLTTTIFVLPPSIKELRRRLIKREGDISFVNNRMKKAKKEITHWREYDYVVVNNNLKKCIRKINCIIESLKCKPQKN